ncbi:probable septin aspE [Cephalotrichum gorgonifer]|uniref:Probable septin aspE n=1 Tax=Cephalotrichum gorgonifer TaxID=2041049 RepID=A0AAE8STS7_9PEZI|nr:probable septin aspE [Cephalotrichum gorgonifer]
MTPPRRSSLGMLLKRNKSGADLGKGRKSKDGERQPSVSRAPPKLPDVYRGHEQLANTFGGDMRPDSLAIVSGNPSVYAQRPSMDHSRYPMPNMPAPPPVPETPSWDPYARTESMTHRGRYSYASSAISTINSPRRVRRRKDPTPFNILIVGTRGSGKSSFLEFLKTSLTITDKRRAKRFEEEDQPRRIPPVGNFVPEYLETEIDGERVGLTLWDSEGLEKNVVDLQLREMSQFLESKFEETFAEEMKVVRSPGVQDTHIHAVFLVLDPARLDRNLATAKTVYANGHNGDADPRPLGALDEDLDLQVMRTLQGKTTVIPVIAKADTITTKHMTALKRSVWHSIKKANLDPLEPLGLDDDDYSSSSSDRIDEGDEGDEEEVAHSDAESGNGEGLPIQGRSQGAPSGADGHRRNSSAAQLSAADDSFLPLSIISPDIYEPGVIGRQFPWGFADPYNEEHCDFTRLKEAVFSEWRSELRVASREQWYEGWRTSRLKLRDGGHRRV